MTAHYGINAHHYETRNKIAQPKGASKIPFVQSFGAVCDGYQQREIHPLNSAQKSEVFKMVAMA